MTILWAERSPRSGLILLFFRLQLFKRENLARKPLELLQGLLETALPPSPLRNIRRVHLARCVAGNKDNAHILIILCEIHLDAGVTLQDKVNLCEHRADTRCIGFPGNQIDIAVLARDGTQPEVERPPTTQPEGELRLRKVLAELAEQLELSWIWRQGDVPIQPIESRTPAGEVYYLPGCSLH